MIKCRRRQATDSQKLKKSCQRPFSHFLLVEAKATEAEAVEAEAAEAEAIGVEAEAFEK